MNLSHLKYFVATCDAGSISGAAKNIYVSQQSISSAIVSLEKDLHVQLLTRSRSGISPTPEGEIVRASALRIFDEIDRMRSDVTKAKENISGSLTLAYIPEVLMSCGPSFERETFETFTRSYPNIALESFVGQSDFCQTAVKQGIVDLGLVTGITDTVSFRVIPVWECCAMIYVHKDHPLAQRSEVSFIDLKDWPILSPPKSGYPLWEILGRCRQYGFSPQIVSVVGDIDSHFRSNPTSDDVGFIVAGFSITNHNESFIAIPFVERDRIIVPANIIVRAGTSIGAQAEALIEHIRNRFAMVDEALATRSGGMAG